MSFNFRNLNDCAGKLRLVTVHHGHEFVTAIWNLYSMICYIPACIWYGSENSVLGFMHDEYVGLAGATSQFYSVAPCRFDYWFFHE